MPNLQDADRFLLTEDLLDRCERIFAASMEAIFSATVEVVAGAEKAEFGGVQAVYAGQGSPLTKATLLRGATDVNFEEIEDFYRDRATAWELTVGPQTSEEILRKAADAGYAVEAMEGILGQFPTWDPELLTVEVEEVTDDRFQFAQVADAGWTGNDERSETLSELSDILRRVPGARYFWAKAEGKPVATGALMEFEEGCLLAGGCTLPAYRGWGYQQALIRRRLSEVPEGKLCLVGAILGGSSYRNLQRHGFLPLYTELVMRRMS